MVTGSPEACGTVTMYWPCLRGARFDSRMMCASRESRLACAASMSPLRRLIQSRVSVPGRSPHPCSGWRTGSILATHGPTNQILDFIGIDDVQTVWTEGMNIPPLAIHADSFPSDHRNRNCGRCHGRAAYTCHHHRIASGSRSSIGRSRWCCRPCPAASDCRPGKDSE
jgi:hypothetical protein